MLLLDDYYEIFFMEYFDIHIWGKYVCIYNTWPLWNQLKQWFFFFGRIVFIKVSCFFHFYEKSCFYFFHLCKEKKSCYPLGQMKIETQMWNLLHPLQRDWLLHFHSSPRSKLHVHQSMPDPKKIWRHLTQIIDESRQYILCVLVCSSFTCYSFYS